MPTRIPFDLLHSRYAAHCGDEIKRLRVPPPIFSEALALALDIPPTDFKLGKSKLFFKAGAGEVCVLAAARLPRITTDPADYH